MFTARSVFLFRTRRLWIFCFVVGKTKGTPDQPSKKRTVVLRGRCLHICVVEVWTLSLSLSVISSFSPFPNFYFLSSLILWSISLSLALQGIFVLFLSNGGKLRSVLLTLGLDPIDFSLLFAPRIHFLSQILNFSFSSSLTSSTFLCQSFFRFRQLFRRRFIRLLPLEPRW